MIYHCAMKYFFDQPWSNAIQAIWMALISEFDFEIKHIKGKENRVVGALSRSVQMIHLETTGVGESNIK
jgi:hypothetical protein